MVTDLFVAPFIAILQFVVNLLPVHTLTLPALDPVAEWIARLDSIIPIAGPLMVVVSVLALAVPFIVVRLALMVRHVIFP
jgi:hypothetical protein